MTLVEQVASTPPANRRGDRGPQPSRRPSVLALLGPAFVASVAYVDPGNVAANVQAGARFGYLLVWVLVVATAAAGLVQYLSAKLGVVTGASLPELVRDRLSGSARVGYWLQAEAVAMATDVAEVIGGAIALQLLFGLPLPVGGLITGAASLVLLSVQRRRGQKLFERLVLGLLLVIASGFVAGLFFDPPQPLEVAAGLLPRLDGGDSIVLATAMFGATVMPHVVYLHSALSRDRFECHRPGEARRLMLRATRTDVVVAMTLAGGVNISMLLLAAGSLRGAGRADTIEGARAAVSLQVGPWAGILFAVALLVSGLASTSVGCQAGSVIMEGLLRRRVGLPIRRALTLVPALVILATDAEPTMLLVASQVVLSLGLPFVLVPLIRTTSSVAVMGRDVNPRATTILGWLVTAAVIGLNASFIAGVAQVF